MTCIVVISGLHRLYYPLDPFWAHNASIPLKCASMHSFIRQKLAFLVSSYALYQIGNHILVVRDKIVEQFSHRKLTIHQLYSQLTSSVNTNKGDSSKYCGIQLPFFEWALISVTTTTLLKNLYREH